MSVNNLSQYRAYIVEYSLPTVGGWTAIVIAPSVSLAIHVLQQQKTKADVKSCSVIESNFIFAYNG